MPISSFEDSKEEIDETLQMIIEQSGLSYKEFNDVFLNRINYLRTEYRNKVSFEEFKSIINKFQNIKIEMESKEMNNKETFYQYFILKEYLRRTKISSSFEKEIESTLQVIVEQSGLVYRQFSDIYDGLRNELYEEFNHSISREEVESIIKQYKLIEKEMEKEEMNAEVLNLTEETNNINPNLHQKKFIITQDGTSLQLYFNKDWDYEVLNQKDLLHCLVIRTTIEKEVNTTVLGEYYPDKINDIVKNLIDFIYDKENFVYCMPSISPPDKK